MDRGARSPLWRQIVCDVLDRPIEYPAGGDVGGAHGAALVAGVALGLLGWDALPPAEGPVVTHAPVAARVAPYQEAYAHYRNLYPRPAADFRRARRSEEAGP